MAQPDSASGTANAHKWQHVLSRFKVQGKTERYWRVHCPAHDDRKDSAIVWEGPNGWLRFKCYAGCSRDEILAAAGLRLQDIGPQGDDRRPKAKRLEATYVYLGVDGAQVGRILRFRPKSFAYEHWDGERWQGGMGDKRFPLYQLPLLMTTDVVWFVEGERDVETLMQHGRVATCIAGGSSQPWCMEYNVQLTGKIVFVCVDADKPGRQFGMRVAKELVDHARRVYVVDLYPERNDGSDITDYLREKGWEDLKTDPSVQWLLLAREQMVPAAAL